MRNILAAFVLVLTLALSAAPARADDNLLSVNIGGFMPGTGYDNTYDSLGPMMGISLVRVNEFAGLEVGLSGFDIGSTGSGTSALGLEVLVHFQGQDYDIQPFMALGMGYYKTQFWSSTMGPIDNYGSGLVLKAGARYYFKPEGQYVTEQDKYFMGAYFKYFSNMLSYPVRYNVSDVDAGGMALCFEIGVWTD